MMTPTTPAEARVAFEHDAEPMGFDLRRHECMAPEPWSEYRDINTGHRWGGYLAATHAATARESALVAERDALRAATKQFYNLTIADPDVLIRAFTESKREAIIEAGRDRKSVV